MRRQAARELWSGAARRCEERHTRRVEHEHGASASGRAMDLVAWKSHIGLTKSGDGVLRATAKGWGRSGAITEAVITRSSAEEGFLIALPQPNVSLFIGVSNLSGSLYDSGRAHQEDLEFSLRVSSDGTLSYSSRARLMQYYYAAHLEADVIGTYEKGDVVGMRLDPQRKGFAIVKQEARSEGGTQLRVLRNFSEVLQFPLKLMEILGGSPMQVGPVTWLKASGDARARRARALAQRPRSAARRRRAGAAGGGGGEMWSRAATRAPAHRSVRVGDGVDARLEAAEEGCGPPAAYARCRRRQWRRPRPRSPPPAAAPAAAAAAAAARSRSLRRRCSRRRPSRAPSSRRRRVPPPKSRRSNLAPSRVARGWYRAPPPPRRPRWPPAPPAAVCSPSGRRRRRACGAAGVYEPRDRRPRDAQFRPRRRHCGGIKSGASSGGAAGGGRGGGGRNPEDDESRQLDLLAAARRARRRGDEPMVPTLWSQVSLALSSPLLGAVDSAALQSIRPTDASLSLHQLRALVAALEHILPSDILGDLASPAAPPPPPPPGGGADDAPPHIGPELCTDAARAEADAEAAREGGGGARGGGGRVAREAAAAAAAEARANAGGRGGGGGGSGGEGEGGGGGTGGGRCGRGGGGGRRHRGGGGGAGGGGSGGGGGGVEPEDRDRRRSRSRSRDRDRDRRRSRDRDRRDRSRDRGRRDRYDDDYDRRDRRRSRSRSRDRRW